MLWWLPDTWGHYLTEDSFLVNHHYATNGYQLDSNPNFGRRNPTEQYIHVPVGKIKTENTVEYLKRDLNENYLKGRFFSGYSDNCNCPEWTLPHDFPCVTTMTESYNRQPMNGELDNKKRQYSYLSFLALHLYFEQLDFYVW